MKTRIEYYCEILYDLISDISSGLSACMAGGFIGNGQKERRSVKKIIAILLIFALLCNISSPVYAGDRFSDLSEPFAGMELETYTYVNPITEKAAGLLPNPLAISDEPDCPDINKVPHFNSFKEAAVYCAGQMKRYAEEVSFAIYMPGDYSGSFWADWQDMDDIIYRHTGVPDEGDYLEWNSVFAWSGWSWSYYDSSAKRKVYIVLLAPTYRCTLAQEIETSEAINQVLASLDLVEKSNYEKIKTVYDWICDNIIYDDAHLEQCGNEIWNPELCIPHTAYAAIKRRICVCQGYATLFYRMMLILGIDCRIIVSETHAWNIVKLGDVYYNVDATWDAGSNGSYTWFLKSQESFVSTAYSREHHVREAEYDTFEFHTAYPMAESDFSFEGHVHVYGWTANALFHWQECTICGEITPETMYIGGYGDVNGDELIDAADALQLLKIAARIQSFAADQLVVGDVNGNGLLEAEDALLVLKKAAKIIYYFPVAENRYGFY